MLQVPIGGLRPNRKEGFIVRSYLLYVTIFAIMSFSAFSARYYFISNGGAGDPFWNVEFNGVKDAAKHPGIEVQILAPEQIGRAHV